MIRNLAAVVGLSVILACGGSDGVPGHSFPLTSSIAVICVNNDAQNVHILFMNEGYDPNVNRVTPGATVNRFTPQSFNWNAAGDTQTITVRAGRNGADIIQGTIVMSGQQRMDDKRIRAVFNANQTLTLTLQ
jgi:hypothetical protein